MVAGCSCYTHRSFMYSTPASRVARYIFIIVHILLIGHWCHHIHMFYVVHRTLAECITHFYAPCTVHVYTFFVLGQCVWTSQGQLVACDNWASCNWKAWALYKNLRWVLFPVGLDVLPGGRQVRSGALGPFPRALGVVGFLRVRFGPFPCALGWSC